ncbi:MAG: ABC transporter permease, partial [Rhodospirillales bacterium]
LAVFALALGRAVETVGGVSFMEFLAPGLIMMAIAQNAFANTSSSIMIAKIQRNIVDTLMPPFTAHGLTLAINLGGATRGIVVGLVVGIVIAFFAPVHIHNPLAILYFAVSASIMLALLGTIGGIWAEKFDHIAAVTNFVVTPLSFLSGTFYTIERLPDLGRFLAHINPFFYMIDGFRYGFIGTYDMPPLLGAGVLLAVNAGLWALCHRMFQTGYKLKA